MFVTLLKRNDHGYFNNNSCPAYFIVAVFDECIYHIRPGATDFSFRVPLFFLGTISEIFDTFILILLGAEGADFFVAFVLFLRLYRGFHTKNITFRHI